MTTLQVSERTGATPRELQCWHEKKYVNPRIDGHDRVWSVADMLVALRIKKLRNKGISLQRVEALLPVIRAAAASSMWLVKNGMKVELTRSRMSALEKAEEMGVIAKLC